jgi:hypothetical protein
MKSQGYVVHMLVICLVVVAGALSVVTAQEGDMIEPLVLSGGPVVLEFSTGAAGPPSIEPLTDGRMTFRIVAAGEVSGAFAGQISARVSEMTPNPPPAFHPVTVMFSIETEQGQIEGYYAGAYHRADGSDEASITATGLILSVSGAYADLYLADVYVSSSVQFVDGRSVGESGTMTIAAR